jgi:hypothetical protein
LTCDMPERVREWDADYTDDADCRGCIFVTSASFGIRFPAETLKGRGAEEDVGWVEDVTARAQQPGFGRAITRLTVPLLAGERAEKRGHRAKRV